MIHKNKLGFTPSFKVTVITATHKTDLYPLRFKRLRLGWSFGHLLTLKLNILTPIKSKLWKIDTIEANCDIEEKLVIFSEAIAETEA